MGIKFEWNEAKRRANLRKHGLDFVGSEAVFEGYTLTTEDTRFDYGERRYATLGLLNDQVVSVVHTETDQIIRLISVRKATRYEQESYFKSFRN